MRIFGAFVALVALVALAVLALGLGLGLYSPTTGFLVGALCVGLGSLGFRFLDGE